MANLHDIPSTADDNVKWSLLTENFRNLRADSAVKVYRGPNGNNVIIGRQEDGNYGVTVTQNDDPVVELDSTGLLAYRNGTPNVLINESGIEVSQDGVDVTTATDEQLVMSSRFNMLKVVDTGTTTVNKPANSAVASNTINHGLGVTPIVLGFVESPNSPGQITPAPLLDVETATGLVQLKVDIEDITTTSFNVTVVTPNLNPGSPFNFAVDATVRYYVFVETSL